MLLPLCARPLWYLRADFDFRANQNSQTPSRQIIADPFCLETTGQSQARIARSAFHTSLHTLALDMGRLFVRSHLQALVHPLCGSLWLFPSSLGFLELEAVGFCNFRGPFWPPSRCESKPMLGLSSGLSYPRLRHHDRQGSSTVLLSCARTFLETFWTQATSSLSV